MQRPCRPARQANEDIPRGIAPNRFWLARVAPLGAATVLILLSSAAAAADPDVPEGVWRIRKRVAVQLFDCAGLVCARIVWLKAGRNAQGELLKDWHNPDPKLRGRPVCGQTTVWNLRPTATNRWKGGWFYDPQNGNTYRISARLKSEGVIIARIYSGSPAFGKTVKLVRVPAETLEGRC